MINNDNDILLKINKINKEWGINWIKNNDEFIGFFNINSEKYMLVLNRTIEKNCEYFNGVATHDITIYNLDVNKMYKIKEGFLTDKLKPLKELYDDISDHYMYRHFDNSPSCIVDSLTTFITEEIKKDVVKQLEDIIKREQEERKLVLNNLLAFINDLFYISSSETTFDTDGDQDEVIVTHRFEDYNYFITRNTIGYIIRWLLDILDNHVVLDDADNRQYVYFIYNGQIYEVGCKVKDSYYMYIKRATYNHSDDYYFKIINLEKIYNEYMKNEAKEESKK